MWPRARSSDVSDGMTRPWAEWSIDQVSAPAPLAALSGLLSELLNDGMGIYEMGAAGTAIERIVIDQFNQAAGFPEQSTGILTSGGTLANLTALMAARAKWRDTQENAQLTPVILVSDQAHYCIERAAMTMGMKPDQVIKIASSSSDFTMDITELENQIKTLPGRGLGAIAIVACACSTASGSYDDIEAISAISRKYDTWLHIDGAHGGAVIFSKKYKYLSKGFREADSIVIDAHKMMLTPALATAILFKDPSDSYRAFNVEASYLFESQQAEWYNLTKRTYETTKYMMGIKVYLLMRYYGMQLIDEYVTSRYDLARKFAELIRENAFFELGHEPMSNIVCFRFSDQRMQKNEFVTMVRKELIEHGEFYIVQTKLNNCYYLRVTIMSPHTTKEDLESLLETLEALALTHSLESSEIS